MHLSATEAGGERREEAGDVLGAHEDGEGIGAQGDQEIDRE